MSNKSEYYCDGMDTRTGEPWEDNSVSELSILQQALIIETENQLETLNSNRLYCNKISLTDDQKLAIADKFIDTDYIWQHINDFIDELIEEYDEPSETEQAKLFAWLEAGDFVVEPTKIDQDPSSCYLFDGDFNSGIYRFAFGRCDLPEGNPDKLYIYTLTEEDGTGYIESGKRLVNRVGYFFSKKYVELPEPFRYW